MIIKRKYDFDKFKGNLIDGLLAVVPKEVRELIFHCAFLAILHNSFIGIAHSFF
jgi:hypothetical protein